MPFSQFVSPKEFIKAKLHPNTDASAILHTPPIANQEFESECPAP